MRYDLRAMGVGAILDRGLRLYIRNFGILLAISLVVVVPVAILDLYLASAIGGTRGDQENIALLVGSVLGLGVNAILMGTLVQAVSDIYLGNAASLGRSFRAAGSRAVPLLLGTLLYTVITSIGTACCILPGLFLLGALFATVPIIVLERQGVIDAMNRSWNLSSGMRIRVFAAIVFAQVQASLSIAPLTILALSLEIGPFHTQAASQVVVALVQPYAAIVLILVYYDLRVRREAFDLQVLAGEMGGGPRIPPGPAGPTGAP
jgi:hypothetical protein